MFDCSKDVRAFHDQEVSLPKSDQDKMRDRRDSNRNRAKKGLAANEKPAPKEFVKQGSYAMKTMICDANNDYDIDDGIYFAKEDLVGDRGAELSSLQARKIVRDALDDGRFTDPPEVHSNCVRVLYKMGYHVDNPVYRRVTEENGNVFYELASSSGWRRSDARDVTDWYENERKATQDGTQLRRVNRVIKNFARSRQSWHGRILSGFGISILAIENFLADTREDVAVYNMMAGIRNRLNARLEIDHPVTPNETITEGPEDSKSAMLRDKLSEALDNLQPLFDHDCTRKAALKCWDKAFATTFFSERYEEEQRAAASAPAIITSSALFAQSSSADGAVHNEGGGRHA